MAKKKRTVSYSRKDIDRLQSKTDWKRVDAMRDEDIDTSEIGVLTDAFWKNVQMVMPHKKKAVGLRIDDDVLEWFRTQGKGYQSHINAVLRAYVHSRVEK